MLASCCTWLGLGGSRAAELSAQAAVLPRHSGISSSISPGSLPPCRCSPVIGRLPVRSSVRVAILRCVMKSPHELRRDAERYRRLVAGVDDRRAIEAITELAAEYDELAAERERRIRRRAYEMWEERWLHGLQGGHWIAAEAEPAEGGKRSSRSGKTVRNCRAFAASGGLMQGKLQEMPAHFG